MKNRNLVLDKERAATQQNHRLAITGVIILRERSFFSKCSDTFAIKSSVNK